MTPEQQARERIDRDVAASGWIVQDYGYDVYRINTGVTAQGGQVSKGFVVDKRSRATRSRRQQLLDEDLAYAAPELDRSVVVPVTNPHRAPGLQGRTGDRAFPRPHPRVEDPHRRQCL